MTLHLDIGPEEKKPRPLSRHVLNVKADLASAKPKKEAGLNLKEEIVFNHQKAPGRICIVGEDRHIARGLGRLPMIAAALLMIFAMNFGQLIFLGKTQGEAALAKAGDAFSDLKSAGEAFTGNGTEDPLIYLQKAQNAFDEAEAQASFLLNHQSQWTVEPRHVSSLRHLLNAGENMTTLGTHLAALQEGLAGLQKAESITDELRDLATNHLEPAQEELNSIIENLDQVDLRGTSYQETVDSVQTQLESLSALVSEFSNWKEALLSMLGDRYPSDILILLMNSEEPKMGGGFIGSYALVQMDEGKMTKFEFKDVYDLDNRFYDTIPAPETELQHLTPVWRMRDSNTELSFPDSAKNALWFFDQEGGAVTPDMVIGINLAAAPNILKAIGPISTPSLGSPLTEENFGLVMTALVEAKTFGKNNPKVILGEFLKKLLEEVGKSTDTQLKVFNTLLTEIQEKNISFYHRDPNIQTLFEDYGLSGSLPKLGEVEGDFLMPVFTSIGGNKTERFMKTDLTHRTQILEDGSIVNALTIRREHTFGEAAFDKMKSALKPFGFEDWTPELQWVLGRAPNKTGLRLYLPEGAQILEVDGEVHKDDFEFKYDQDQDLSYYYLEQEVEAGEATYFTLVYLLPWNLEAKFSDYQFKMFKQIGFDQLNYEKSVAAESNLFLSSDLPSEESGGEYDFLKRGVLSKEWNVNLLYK